MSTIKLDHVPLLVGSDNFESWKRAIRQVLQGEGYWGHVDGDADVFSPFPISPKPAVCNEQSTLAQVTAFRDWWKEDSRTRTIVERRISPIILNLLPQGDTVTARDVWTMLQTTYGRVDIMAQFALRDHVNNLKLLDHYDLDRYIGEFRTAKLRFVQMGVSFNELEMVHAILSGLPSSSHWPHFHQLMTQTIQNHLDQQRNVLVPAAPDTLLNHIIARLVIECQRLQSTAPFQPMAAQDDSGSPPPTANPLIPSVATASSYLTTHAGDLSC